VITLFGKAVHEPRLTAWYGDHDYSYSGRTLARRAPSDPLRALMAKVAAAAGGAFNAVLNRYRDGNDSMGLHADDEPELGPDPLIGSLSLGVTRRFVLVPKRRTEQRSGCSWPQAPHTSRCAARPAARPGAPGLSSALGAGPPSSTANDRRSRFPSTARGMPGRRSAPRAFFISLFLASSS
jgi:hypothetical protein